MGKTKELFVSVVVVAAGKGSRMKMEMNKQYVEICGKAVLARTLQVFEDCGEIDEIILVVNGSDIVYCKQELIDRYQLGKVKSIVAGGSERQESVYNGLREVSTSCNVVLIHDGARPFIHEDSIINSIHAAQEFGAACVAVPVKDTMKIADPEGFVSQTIDRSTMWAIQTPQSFRYGLILEAHQKAVEAGFSGTDDSMLAERLGYRVKLVMGGYDNIKITTREDLHIGEAIVRSREEDDFYKGE